MAKQDTGLEFDAAAGDDRARFLNAPIPKGLDVVRYRPDWAHEWSQMVGQEPQRFYDMLCRNIRGKVEVGLDLFDPSDDNFTIHISDNGRSLFKADNKLFHRSFGKFLYLKEWACEDSEAKGRGIGLTLFRNVLDCAEAAKLDYITLKGGREDGRFFWPAHGFYFRDPHSVDSAIPKIADNLAKYSGTIPDNIHRQARQFLDEGGVDLCWKVARLPGTVKVGTELKPLGWALLDEHPESDYEINLNDAKQMERVRESLVRKAPALGRHPALIVH